MSSLLQAADREYAAIQSGKALKHTLTIAGIQGDFDFMTSEETKAGPVHVVEIGREEARRAKAGAGPRDLSREEFAQQLGISEADTADPTSGLSLLSVSEAMRAYYGDPQDEAYRAFRQQLVHYGENHDWLKGTTFTNATIEMEVDRMHQVETWDRIQEERDEVQGRARERVDDAPESGASPSTPQVLTESPAKSTGLVAVPVPRIRPSSSPAGAAPPVAARPTRAANMAANYRKKMQDDFKARQGL